MMQCHRNSRKELEESIAVCVYSISLLQSKKYKHFLSVHLPIVPTLLLHRRFISVRSLSVPKSHRRFSEHALQKSVAQLHWAAVQIATSSKDLCQDQTINLNRYLINCTDHVFQTGNHCVSLLFQITLFPFIHPFLIALVCCYIKR